MGVYDERMEGLCLTQREIQAVHYQPGTAVNVYVPEKGHYEIKPGWIVDNFDHYILVRIDGARESYNMTVDKVDIKRGVYKIKEVN